MADIAVLLGAVMALIGLIWFLVVAFKESWVWAIICFIPLGPILFFLLHKDKAGVPFALYMVGLALLYVGSAVLGEPIR